MSQKHFIAVALDIRVQVDRHRDSLTPHSSSFEIKRVHAVITTLRELAGNLAHTFATFNPNFKRGLFLTACGF